jgi:hypothetical protein
MAFDRAAAKAEGYTDDEINAYLQAQSAENKTTPVNSIDDLPAPTTVIQEPNSSMASTAATAGLAAAPYIVPAAAGAAAAIGGSKLYGAWNASAKAAQALADAKLASEQGIANRFAQKMPSYNVPTGNVPTTAGPVAPQAMPSAPQVAQAAPQVAQAAEQPGIMQRGMQYANQMRQAAAQRVMQAAPQMAEAASSVGRTVAPALGMAGRALTAANPYITAAQGLTYSKSLGPQVPMQGQYRGMEINPNTGRPWTPQELAQINR